METNLRRSLSEDYESTVAATETDDDRTLSSVDAVDEDSWQLEDSEINAEHARVLQAVRSVPSTQILLLGAKEVVGDAIVYNVIMNDGNKAERYQLKPVMNGNDEGDDGDDKGPLNTMNSDSLTNVYEATPLAPKNEEEDCNDDKPAMFTDMDVFVSGRDDKLFTLKRVSRNQIGDAFK
jgi:hypothetical protein